MIDLLMIILLYLFIYVRKCLQLLLVSCSIADTMCKEEIKWKESG